MKSHTSNHAVTESGNRVKSTLHDLISGTEDLLRSTASYGGSEIESVRDRLKRQLDSARDQVRSGERNVVDRYHQVTDVTDEYVHEHAWKTAGIALVVGLIIGACMMSDSWRQGR